MPGVTRRRLQIRWTERGAADQPLAAIHEVRARAGAPRRVARPPLAARLSAETPGEQTTPIAVREPYRRPPHVADTARHAVESARHLTAARAPADSEGGRDAAGGVPRAHLPPPPGSRVMLQRQTSSLLHLRGFSQSVSSRGRAWEDPFVGGAYREPCLRCGWGRASGLSADPVGSPNWGHPRAPPSPSSRPSVARAVDSDGSS